MQEKDLKNNQQAQKENANNQKETILKEKKKETKEERKLRKKHKVKKYTFRKYFYGVGKEFERISWTSRKNLVSSFIVVIVVITFFALVFTGVTLGILAI